MVNHSSVRLHFNQGHHSPGKGEAVVYLTTPLPFFGLFADSAFPLVQMTLKRGSCAVVAVLQGARGGVRTGHVSQILPHFTPHSQQLCVNTLTPFAATPGEPGRRNSLQRGPGMCSWDWKAVTAAVRWGLRVDYECYLSTVFSAHLTGIPTILYCGFRQSRITREHKHLFVC